MYALLVVKYSFALGFQGSLGEMFRGWCSVYQRIH